MKQAFFGFLKQKISKPDAESVTIEKVKKGDREAFAALYMNYIDQIYRYLYFHLNENTTEAEDITEIVFLKAWENIASFRKDKGTFQAWLYTIAHNAYVDHIRKNKHTESLDESIIDPSAVEPLEALTASDHQQSIQEALLRLTKEQRQVVLLKFVEEMENEQIAKVMNKKEDAIRALQHRALKTLRTIVQEYE